MQRTCQPVEVIVSTDMARRRSLCHSLSVSARTSCCLVGARFKSKVPWIGGYVCTVAGCLLAAEVETLATNVLV